MELGIVTEVVPGASLAMRAREVASLIASNSPAAVRASKRILWEALEHNLGDAHGHAIKISARVSRPSRQHRGSKGVHGEARAALERVAPFFPAMPCAGFGPLGQAGGKELFSG